jgi:hypothetical protein
MSMPPVELSGSPRDSGAAPTFHIERCDREHPQREEAERFVQARFQRAHGAQITTFMPTLLLYKESTGPLWGVTGCRSAATEPLFLERYLAAPIEAAITASTGARVRRHDIVEVGNFASLNPRAATRFVSRLPRLLLEEGHTWIAFTATSSIRRILQHLGARCADLGPADGACVRHGPDQWGRYYSNDPRVLVGYLPLARRIPALWSASHAD